MNLKTSFVINIKDYCTCLVFKVLVHLWEVIQHIRPPNSSGFKGDLMMLKTNSGSPDFIHGFLFPKYFYKLIKHGLCIYVFTCFGNVEKMNKKMCPNNNLCSVRLSKHYFFLQGYGIYVLCILCWVSAKTPNVKYVFFHLTVLFKLCILIFPTFANLPILRYGLL